MDLLPLEAHLKKENETLFNLYNNMKKKVDERFLDDIKQLEPWYTDHGLSHSKAVINTLGEMIVPSAYLNSDVRNELKEFSIVSKKISDIEVFVLISAALWHDVGMLIGRESHATKLIDFVNEIDRYVDDRSVTQTIFNIACAHSSDKKFKECINSKPMKLFQNSVIFSEKTLAAMLRIADEVSEDRTRVSHEKHIQKKIPKENLIFWEHAMSIDYSSIRNNLISIRYVLDIEKIFTEYQYNGCSKTLYAFISERICKLITELTICSPYFSNIYRIDAIDLRVEVHRMNHGICEEELLVPALHEKITPFFSPMNIELLSKYYEAYPNFHPIEIKRKVGV